MTDFTYPLFPIFAFLGFVLALVPLPWHLEAWNSATCYYMIWASLASFNAFVNAVVWQGNIHDSAPAWCEISTRLTIAASVGIPAASLCINQRLYNIAKVQAVMVTKSEKRRAVLYDTMICVILPIIVVVLSYVVQGHRYNIIEDLGCFPALYNTLLTYFLVNWWPLVLGLIASIYCALSLLAFNRRRVQFNEFLTSKKSSLTLGRYFRLMALSTTSLLLAVPIATYGIYLNATLQQVGPWRSWDDTHLDFGRVERVPALFWRANKQSVVVNELNRWLSPVCALIFFAYFGLAGEARRNYKTAFWWVAGKFGLKPATQSKKMAGMRPLHLGKPPAAKPFPLADPLPPYSPPKPPRLNLTDSFMTSSSYSASDIDLEKGIGYNALPSASTLCPPISQAHPFHVNDSAPSLPLPLPLPPISMSPIPPRSSSRSPSPVPALSTSPSTPSQASTPFTLTPPAMLPDSRLRWPRSPGSPGLSEVSPTDSRFTGASPTDSTFSQYTDGTRSSIAFSELEARYGARMPSFVSLQVEVSSEPPTPLVAQASRERDATQ